MTDSPRQGFEKLFELLTGKPAQPEKPKDGPNVGRTDGDHGSTISTGTGHSGGGGITCAPQIL